MFGTFKKIAKTLQAIALAVLNILVRTFLAVVYFTLLLPFGLWIRLTTDFLRVKKEVFSWRPRPRIENLKEFLTRQ
jgi:hypothetical protein